MALNARAIYPSSNPDFISFPSRRSVVHSTQGIIACTQPLAAQAGQRILRDGGNAADAAVAVAAALNMTEPSSTGIGGDMFCLFYAAKERKVRALNGSGRSSQNSTLARMRDDLGMKPGDPGEIPIASAHSVTTPGAAGGWVDTVEKFGSGKLSLEQILTPAIELGEQGFPVSELASFFWRNGEKAIKKASPNFGEILKSDPHAPDGKRAPLPGELMKNPTLANTFRLLAKHGKKGFYSGSVAEAIVKVVQDLGGRYEMDDLSYHLQQGSQEGDAIRLRFNGQDIGKVHTHPVDGRVQPLGRVKKASMFGNTHPTARALWPSWPSASSRSSSELRKSPSSAKPTTTAPPTSTPSSNPSASPSPTQIGSSRIPPSQRSPRKR
ncbi:hypothetical protein XPA_003332 [Xanthoria parietina]